jgi:hypothetical protein
MTVRSGQIYHRHSIYDMYSYTPTLTSCVPMRLSLWKTALQTLREHDQIMGTICRFR